MKFWLPLLAVASLLGPGWSAQEAPLKQPSRPTGPVLTDEEEWTRRFLLTVAGELDIRCPLQAGWRIEFGAPPTLNLGPIRGATSVDPLTGDFVFWLLPASGIEAAIDVLIHEWAHAMVWGVPSAASHDEHWGIAYSRAYRAVLSAAQMGRFQHLHKEQPAR